MNRLGNRSFITIIAVAFFAFSAIGVSIVTADTLTQPDAITPDGGKYYGPLVNGKRHGNGKVLWENGASYEGGFENGLYSGRGKYASSSGHSYEGDFQNGRMSGNARYVMPDGGVYIGHFANDLFNGQGKYQMSSGQTYVGLFSNGAFEGKGKFTAPGEEYEGEFKKNLYSGQGEVKYTDGRQYKGGFEKGAYQGKGRYALADGQFYEGDFDKGIFTGSGAYQAKDGSRHEGAFRKWRPHGIGTYTDAGGNVYEGIFADGDLSGAGKKLGKDGSRYEGEFKNWALHGQGIYRSANGDEYKGNFSYGSYSGEGTLTYATPQKDGRSKDSGTWQYGALVDKEAEKQTKVNVETALYAQRALLDKTFAGIAPRVPGKPNLYLLAIGGDGSQEVFHREVKFVQNQFDRDFGTQSRSLILVNSRNTVATIPMATLTSIRESIAAIAARMDKEKDILFLYLTSHGSKTHEFTLDQNGMDLRNLPAKELGEMLKESGIRWKAVVVSACYAGGFIDPLKNEYTMVIAAARHDRRSFGCADENDFTYFGRAFFKESLPGSTSLDEAFRKAQALVTEWEKADVKESKKSDDETHSEPQIHYPKKFDQYWREWWKLHKQPGTQVVRSK